MSVYIVYRCIKDCMRYSSVFCKFSDFKDGKSMTDDNK